MDIKELFLESIGTLTINKLRTSLATLGIVIGIGSVIALVSLGQSSQKSVQNQIQSLGSNLLTVIPGSTTTGAVRGAVGAATSLTLDDAKAISSSGQVTTVKNVSPEYSSRTQVTAGRNNTNVQIIGATPAYAEVRKVTIDAGNFITSQDVESMNKVAVLGPQVASDLFGAGASSVGQIIRAKGISLRVVGVTQSKGGSGFLNQDNLVFVPLPVAQKLLFGGDYLTSISVEASSENVMVDAQNQIGYELLARHKLNDVTRADFSIFSQNDILGAANQVTGTFTALLSGIAAISLLVGGIGIMNIMLVTVTERTREIGLRKALGAKKRVITTQFLIESIILTFAGGILGMVVGIVISIVIANLISLPFTLSTQSIFLAIGVSAAIGILFGWYPARRAANLQPIEALRYE